MSTMHLVSKDKKNCSVFFYCKSRFNQLQPLNNCVFIRNTKILRHRGAFIHQDELEEHSHVFRLLAGAEKFEDEDGWDGDSDPLGLINSQYGDEIEAIRQQCDDKEREKQKQENDIKDLTEKVRPYAAFVWL